MIKLYHYILKKVKSRKIITEPTAPPAIPPAMEPLVPTAAPVQSFVISLLAFVLEKPDKPPVLSYNLTFRLFLRVLWVATADEIAPCNTPPPNIAAPCAKESPITSISTFSIAFSATCTVATYLYFISKLT